jgi:short-subunit dehydrogenase
VNNAGFGSSGSFADLPAGTAEDQIRLNVTAVVRLTHAALPGMLQRGHGGVLNVSSVAGFVPSPGAATYGATKAFVTSFSENLSAEVKHRGVHVTALCPGFTRTERGDVPASAPAGLAWLDVDKVARAGLDAVAAGRVLTVPGAQYKSVVSLTRVVPRGVLRSAAKAMRRP